MYTSFPFTTMIFNTLSAIDEAFQFESRQPPCSSMDGAPPQLTLSTSGWSWIGEGYTCAEIADLLVFLLHNNYNYNGDRAMRQNMGLPMGMPDVPISPATPWRGLMPVGWDLATPTLFVG